MPVAEHLHFYMARPLHDLLDQHGRIAERRRCLALRALERGDERIGALDQPHSAPAAACDRLYHHGIADAARFALKQRRVLRAAVIAGHDRHVRLARDRLRRGFAAELAHGVAARPNEGDAGRCARIGKVRVFGEEAVAGMDRFGAGRLGRRDDAVAA